MYVNRDRQAEFDQLLTIYNLVVVVGARQAGKTTFCRHQERDRSVSYVLFDDPDVRALFEADLNKFELQHLEGHDFATLDEVQQASGAGRKLKYLVDTGRKLWVTSSSEILLGKEVLSHLVGRAGVLRLFPFSLDEFLAARGRKAFTPELLERCVWEHATYGGYPRVVTTGDPALKSRLLQDLLETMLLKDIARTFSITDLRSLEACVRYLATGSGALLAYEKMASSLDISFATLKKYLAALEQSYLTVSISPFFTNRRKELVKRPRVYFLDTGMRNAVTGRFEAELEGGLFENYVLCELLKLGFSPRFWRTKAGAEVDFVVETGAGIVPVEVKLQTPPDRITRGLRSFIRTYRPAQALVVRYRGEAGSLDIEGCRVDFIPVTGLEGILKPVVKP